MRNLVIAAALSGLALAGCSQPADETATIATTTAFEPAVMATSAEINEADLRYRISTLADDGFEGRAPAAPGGIAASQWIADEMARIGLEPGNQGSFFQPVSLLEITLDTARSAFDVFFNGEPLDLAMGP